MFVRFLFFLFSMDFLESEGRGVIIVIGENVIVLGFLVLWFRWGSEVEIRIFVILDNGFCGFMVKYLFELFLGIE